MENRKTEMGLLELILLDSLMMAIFVLFIFIAAVNPSRSLYAMNLPLVFGGVTIPFAGVFAKWLNYLRHHEGNKIAAKFNIDPYSNKWLFWDLGTDGYAWMFRVMSGLMIVFSIYHFFN